MKYGDITNNKEIQEYYKKGNSILASLPGATIIDIKEPRK